jgi:hypothetical protein
VLLIAFALLLFKPGRKKEKPASAAAATGK